MATVTIRLDQTIPFTTNWTDQNGNPIAPPTPIAASADDPSKASVVVSPDGSGTVTPLAITTTAVAITVTGNGTLHPAKGFLNIVAAQVLTPTTGTMTWGTPTP